MLSKPRTRFTTVSVEAPNSLRISPNQEREVTDFGTPPTSPVVRSVPEVSWVGFLLLRQRTLLTVKNVVILYYNCTPVYMHTLNLY